MTAATLNAPATPSAPALMRALSRLIALRGGLRAAARARRLGRAAEGLGALSRHYLDDIGLGDSFGVAAADTFPRPPSLRS